MKCLKASPLGDLTIVKTFSVAKEGDRRRRANPRSSIVFEGAHSRSNNVRWRCALQWDSVGRVWRRDGRSSAERPRLGV